MLHFLLGLEKAGVEFVAIDMPSANRLQSASSLRTNAADQ
jgi:hypothetical protein